MTPEEFQQTEAVFQAACALPADERIAFVDERCAGDARMHSRVVRLLRHDDKPAAGLEQQIGTAVRAVSDVLLHKKATPMPKRIGAYRIIRQLGEGGFGVVYLAEQENPRRTVALKVVRWMVASPDAVARFEHEAHVLGQLQHAGIAQIFEAGVADAEFDASHAVPLPPRMPYYTMEYIQGRNLIEYASAPSSRDHPLDISERLELIARVCDALQHAHQNGIIHRDLKPDNILVVDANVSAGLRSASGTRLFGAQPKLLDFGVARALEPDDAAGATRTHVGQIVGTPAYMSPEQVRGEPNRVDIRSDVYAIGVLLYQLASGKLPYEFPSSRMADIARVIEAQPPTPIRSGGTTRASRINPDIEAIIAKALAKEPERRYQSAAALSSDIRRFLADEPIEAKRDSALYLLRKNAKRYRAALLVAGGFVVLIAVFAVWATAQARINRQLAQQSILAKDEAYTERDRANQTSKRLAAEVSQSTIDRGRALGQAGNIIDAEKLIWTEYLRNPSSMTTVWALREHYSRFPIRSSIHTGLPVICTMALSPDETLAAIAGDNAQVEIWDRRSSTRIATFEAGKKYADELCFSPDGTILAGAIYDGHVMLWSTRDWSPIATMKAHGAAARTVCFVQEGSRLLSGGRDGVIAVWDGQTGAHLAAYRAHRASVMSLRLSPDANMVASASGDKTISLWNVEGLTRGLRDATAYKPVTPPAEARLKTLTGHVDSVSYASFSSDGRRLVSASTGFDRSIRLWDLETGTSEAMRPSAGILDPVEFSPDNRRVFGGGWFTLDVFDVETTHRLSAIKGKYTSIQLADHGQLAVTTTVQDLLTFDIRPQPAFLDLGPLSGRSVTFAANGSMLVTSQADGSLQLRDAKSGEIKSVFKTDGAITIPEDRLIRMRAVCASPVGDKLVSVSLDKTLRRWDVATGKCEATIKDASWTTQQSVAFSPDGESWAYSRRDATIAIGKVVDSKPAVLIPSGSWEALSICYSPDGQMIATTAREWAIRLWTADGKSIARLTSNGPPWGLAFSPDGKYILAGTWHSTIEVFDTQTHLLVSTLEGHLATIWAVQFMPDDPDVFATCSADGTVRIWSLSSGRNMATIDACPGDEAIAMSLSPDGRRIAVACSDGEVRVWEMNYADECIEGNRRSHMQKVAALNSPTNSPTAPGYERQVTRD